MKGAKDHFLSIIAGLTFCALLFCGGGAKSILFSAVTLSSGLQMLRIGSSDGGKVIKSKQNSEISEQSAGQTNELSSDGETAQSFDGGTDNSSGESVRPTDVETGDIKSVALEIGGNCSTDGVHINNTAGVDIDVASLLSQGLPFTVEQSDEPQVLIYHTHGTECYSEKDDGFYIKDSDHTRSTDTSKNTIRVGDAIAEELNNNGIITINDRTMHDKDSYTGSYSRSEQTVREYLEKYPSIKVVIDGHRDSITQSNGTKIKPTAEINGKKAAQVMVLAGCQSGDITDYPNWQENLRFNLILQKCLETDYPGLARTMSFKSCKYNFDIMNGSILLEIGSEANTLEEAIYSGQLIGKALVKIFKSQ